MSVGARIDNISFNKRMVYAGSTTCFGIVVLVAGIISGSIFPVIVGILALGLAVAAYNKMSRPMMVFAPFLAVFCVFYFLASYLPIG